MITPSGNSLNLTYCKDRRQALRDLLNTIYLLPEPLPMTRRTVQGGQSDS